MAGSSPRFAGNAEPHRAPELFEAVHPRVCGERSLIVLQLLAQFGSSPRLRGTREADNAALDQVRFIPAFAGNAQPCFNSNRIRPVHPRVCGERAVPMTVGGLKAGSSPRLRGTRSAVSARRTYSRFIPAFAGNASASRGGRRCPTVHPRVCGERPLPSSIFISRTGSSPRLRGTQQPDAIPGNVGRFIPAFAGNARPRPRRSRGGPVHPRVCGERARSVSGWWRSGGSSPRLRGTLRHQGREQLLPRFIPAFAGNASFGGGASVPVTVHPRVCGERIHADLGRSSAYGSSPRLRGTPGQLVRAQGGGRFIPAFAGNAPAPPWPTVQRPVHPRVCGERRPGQNVPVHPAGSSPRLRGTLGARVVVQVKRRFIPAFAGNAVLMPLSAEEMAVHPRVCGERFLLSSSTISPRGSSPRLRGTPHG